LPRVVSKYRTSESLVKVGNRARPPAAATGTSSVRDAAGGPVNTRLIGDSNPVAQFTRSAERLSEEDRRLADR
jgi:hypothetical protein